MRHRDLCLVAVLTLALSAPAPGSAQEIAAPQPQQPHDAQPLATPPPDVHPAPAHTGLAALFHTTVDDFKALPQRKSTWVILGIGGAAALLAHPADDTLNARLAGSGNAGRFFAPGKYLGAVYTHAAVSVGLYAIGRYVLPGKDEPRTNRVSHLGFDLLRAQIVSQAIVQVTKKAVRRDRPTGNCCAFPSGHAATAFAAASVIERHFDYRMAWPTLLAATYVAASRLHDNKHVLSDVVFGAAVGTATGWTIVGRHGRSSYALRPVPIPGGMAFVMTK